MEEVIQQFKAIPHGTPARQAMPFPSAVLADFLTCVQKVCEFASVSDDNFIRRLTTLSVRCCLKDVAGANISATPVGYFTEADDLTETVIADYEGNRGNSWGC